MKELLSIEWLKLKRYRTFWVLTVLFLVLLPLINLSIIFGAFTFGGSGGLNLITAEYSFPKVWDNMGHSASWLIQCLAILVIIITCNEFSYRTNRQNIIDGLSKMQFYHSKVYLVVVLSLLATLYTFFNATLFGICSSGSFSGFGSTLLQAGYFFICCLDYLGFGLFMGLWLRRSGLSIALFLVYAMFVEAVFSGIFNKVTGTSIGDFLFLQSADDLFPFPLIKQAKELQHIKVIPQHFYALAAAAWCTVYYFVGRAILTKRDW